MSLFRDVRTSADRTSRRVGAAVSALWSGSAWRATGNALAALLVGLVGGILLGGLALIWGAAIYSLVHWPVGGWGHAVLYIAVVVVGPVLALWAVQGLTALQRSRLRATLGVDIPLGPRAGERKPWPVGPWLAAATWPQLGVHLLAIVTGVGRGCPVAAACGRAPRPAIAYGAAGGPPPAAGAAALIAAAGLLLAAPWAARQVTRADQASARALLGPSHNEELALRLESMTRSRADAVA